jgi:predicted Rossmann fold flavoprotein
MQFDLIVIGGGAAGFFGAIQAGEMKSGLRILILEKTNKILSKVRVSGGGRCNVTHHCFNPFDLARHYPRGEKFLKILFKEYHAEHIVKWFDSKKVALKFESDGRMFPVTDSSETIIDCFITQVQRLKIKMELGKRVVHLESVSEKINVVCDDGSVYQTDKVLVATGGSPQEPAYDFIREQNHTIRKPVPSLFTFNDPEKKFTDLMGVAVPTAEVKIAGTKFLQRGPVLITHWGLSGPAVIKLSAWAAEYLHGLNYEFTVLVNWLDQMKEEELRGLLIENKSGKGKQKVLSSPLFGLPQRLWGRLLALSQIDESAIWSEVSKKELNRLLEFLIRCPFQIKGKTTFKEEFVTCGGVELADVNVLTMESQRMRNVFFAGEVLNIDGETGGFNFQSAWTTAYVAARSITSS